MSTVGEAAKETYEDLATLAASLPPGGEADRALEAILRRVLRGLANPTGRTRGGVAQGVSRFVATRYAVRDPEAGK